MLVSVSGGKNDQGIWLVCGAEFRFVLLAIRLATTIVLYLSQQFTQATKLFSSTFFIIHTVVGEY